MATCAPATEPHGAYTDAILREKSVEFLTQTVVHLVLAWLAFFSAGPLILLCMFLGHSLKRILGRGGRGGGDPMAVQQLEAALAEANGDRVRYVNSQSVYYHF